jgi:hypothetical protein
MYLGNTDKTFRENTEFAAYNICLFWNKTYFMFYKGVAEM